MFLSKTNTNIEDWYNDINSEGSFALIDKEEDWTSFDVVAKMRSITKIKKIGHAGTLDPFATGLLIVALGRGATKRINEFQDADKTYTGIIKLGATTASYDNASEEENIVKIPEFGSDDLNEIRKSFLGVIEQFPPIYSAKKVNGKPLYKYARKNQEVEIKSQKVEIFEFDIIKTELPFIHFRIRCSKGTYIRSIANDFGARLGCGAYLFELRRTEICGFKAEDALKIKEFETIFVKFTTEKLQKQNESLQRI